MTYHLLRFLLKLISHIPFCVLYAFSGGMYFLIYHIAGYRRKIVRKNLTESFPEKNEAEIKKIEKDFYHFFTDNILEISKMGAMSAQEMEKRMKFTNIEEVNEVLRQGKSVALFLGHYANWEWISSIPLHLDPIARGAQIYHKLSNPDFDKIMLENRAAHGAVNVEMRKTARYMNEMAVNRQVSIIGFIADQAPRKKDIHYYIPFLNHKTPVLTGTEKTVKHFGYDTWFVKPKMIAKGHYEVEFIHMRDNTKHIPDYELTDLYYDLLEKTIKQHPELYLWTHKRFRAAQLLDT